MIKVNTKGFNLAKAVAKHRAALGSYADTEAKRMEAVSKDRNSPTGAKWEDRSGIARQSITGDHGWQGNKLKVRLSGGPDYFVYLELAHEKKWATLKPTIDANAQKILRGYQRLVKG
jgi:hypothetical protein